MSNDRIKIDVPLGTPLSQIEFSAIEQSVSLCEGNRHRAARRLDITVTRVNRFLKKFARSENEAATESGNGGSAIPSFPGGQEEKSTVDS